VLVDLALDAQGETRKSKMIPHPLDPLFKPRSLAIVGASDKPDSNGFAMQAMAAIDGYDGSVYPVNPRLSMLDGRVCYPDLAHLPEVPDHVIIGVASSRVEEVLDEAISHGVPSASIFASCYLEGDPAPRLPQRIANKARAADMSLCGANCMGFYVPSAGLRVASMPSPPGIRAGGIAWIAQSGSTFGALAHNDRRLGFSLCVSTGMELVTTVADYMDWAMAQPETRVIGLFLETVRAPDQFVVALKKAQEARIPVVALKVGRTEVSARMAVSHTGAIAGNDAAYRALFRKYGVIVVEDMDEMAATLALFDSDRRPSSGGLGVVSDSGGEREMIVDLADRIGITFPPLNARTCAKIAEQLEPGLHPENPLDAYGTNANLVPRYAAMMADLTNDPAIAMGFFMSDPRDAYGYAEQYSDAVMAAAGMTDKPLALVSNYAMVDDRQIAQKLLKSGIPLLRGTKNALKAARHLMRYRDFKVAPVPDDVFVSDDFGWRDVIAEKGQLSEADGLRMLADFGIASPAFAHTTSLGEVASALETLHFPVVLKTAEDHAHKSDVGGVVLNLRDLPAAQAAYTEMAARLGPRALFMEMAPKGVELSLGSIWDDSFGPVVVISAGGVLVEFLDDSVAALAPVTEPEALGLLKTLKCYRLLQGVRGAAPADIADVAQQIAAFSRMIATLGPACAESDINPLICTGHGALALDCLVVGPKA
jgi:acyl-CoA synthetase (NDP forming)